MPEEPSPPTEPRRALRAAVVGLALGFALALASRARRGTALIAR